MKVLVTGSKGWIGSEVCNVLADCEIIRLDRKLGLDIFDSEALYSSMMGCDAVIHLAAIPHPIPGAKWEDYWTVNVLGTQKVAEAAACAGKLTFVYSSSTAYYGAQRDYPLGKGKLHVTSANAVQRFLGKVMPKMTPYNEAALAYMCSKVAAETILAAYGYSGRLNVHIVRLGPVTRDGKPWAYGLVTGRSLAAQALATAALLEEPRDYSVENVVNPEVKRVAMLQKR